MSIRPASGACVARLALYPFKSLDGQDVEFVRFLPSGALEHDRAYALFDADGRIVNAKRHPVLQRLRTRLDLATGVLDTRAGEERRRFDLRHEKAPLADRFGAALGFAVILREDRTTGFPDDEASPGPTVIGTATLEAVAGWFDLPLDSVRARLRANIEIAGVPAFWEDQLFAAEGTTVTFRVGQVALEGVNPCLRCAVPARDPWTGEFDSGFAETFADRRARDLPNWSRHDRFKPSIGLR